MSNGDCRAPQRSPSDFLGFLELAPVPADTENRQKEESQKEEDIKEEIHEETQEEEIREENQSEVKDSPEVP